MEIFGNVFKKVGQAILVVLLVISPVGGLLLYEYLLEKRNSRDKTNDNDKN